MALRFTKAAKYAFYTDSVAILQNCFSGLTDIDPNPLFPFRRRRVYLFIINSLEISSEDTSPINILLLINFEPPLITIKVLSKVIIIEFNLLKFTTTPKLSLLNLSRLILLSKPTLLSTIN